MDAPLAFRIGEQTSTNIGQSIRKGKDQSAIDEILTRAMQSDDPNQLNQSFAQLLSNVSPERQGMAAQVLQNRAQQLQQKQQQEALQRFREQTQVNANTEIQKPSQEVSKEQQLQILDQQEQQLLNTGFDPKLISEDLKSIRSRRNVIAQELSGGEKEAGKEAAKRRSKTIDSLSDKSDAAGQTLTAVDGLESLVKTGATGPSLRNSLTKATAGQGGLLGVVNDFMQSAEKQGFDSAQRAFFPQLKAFFGSRITDVDLNTFMSTLAQFGTDPKAQELALATLRQQATFDVDVGNAALNLIDDDGRPVKGFERKLKVERKRLEKESRDFFQQKAEELGIIRGANPSIKTSVGTFNRQDLIDEANRRNLFGNRGV